jgi:hypothetical protein
VFVVGLRVGAGMVDDAVPMIRRCIERIQLQWNIAGIDNVVMAPAGTTTAKPARIAVRTPSRIASPLPSSTVATEPAKSH